MKHDEFIGHVQHYARLPSRGDAERATRVTLETLGERLVGGEPKDLASQLPPEIGLHLLRYAGMWERFSLDEFFRRVSEREGEDLPQAVFHARAVIRVLSEAVSPGEINDILAQLPPEFDRFFREAIEGRCLASCSPSTQAVAEGREASQVFDDKLTKFLSHSRHEDEYGSAPPGGVAEALPANRGKRQENEE